MKHLLAPVLATILAAGCATSPRGPLFAPGGDSPAWPAPPEAQRVVHVADIRRHQDIFAERGFWTRIASFVGGPRDSRMVRPYAIAVHPGGGIVVTDPGLHRVHFHDWAERRYVAIGDDLEGGLPSPVGVAVALDGTILVADSRLARVERFSRRGRHLGSFGEGAELLRPAGIAVDPVDGKVYVADVLSHRIAVFDPHGQHLRSIGSNGSAPGEFNFPTHLAVDDMGNVLVADSMNFRIQRIASGGTPLECFGKAGDAQGDFARPKGVASLGADRFAAVEGLYDSIVFFDASGQLLLSIGGTGSAAGEFWLPSGLAYDAREHLLFVADSYNARVQAFLIRTDDPGIPPAVEDTP